MRRRDFIKKGSLFVPAIFVPRLIRSQAYTFRDPAMRTVQAGTVGNLSVDLYFQLAGQSGAMSSTKANNGTVPSTPGYWTLTGTGLSIVSKTNNLHSTVTAGGVTYAVDNAALAMASANSSAGNYLDGGAAGNSVFKVTVAGFVFLGGATGAGGGGLFDLYVTSTDASPFNGTMQLNASGSNFYLNIESNPGFVTTHSSPINVSASTWYWCSFCADYTSGVATAYLDVYKASDFSLVGSVTGTLGSNEHIGLVRIGQGEFGTSTGSNTLEHTVIAFGSKAIHPLGP